MRFSPEARACAEIELLHKKRKEFQSTARLTDWLENEKPKEWYEKEDPIEHDLIERQEKAEFWKNPHDPYDISTKEASLEVTERKWMSSKELHDYFMNKK